MHERVWVASCVSFLTFGDLSKSLSESGVLFLISFFIKHEIKEKRSRVVSIHLPHDQQSRALPIAPLNLAPLFP